MSLGKEPYVDTQTNGCGVHHPRQLSTADDADGETPPSGHPPKRTGHYDGQPAPTAGARGLCIQSSLPFASDEGGALMAARQSAINTVTMTGSLRRLEELAAVACKARSRSRATKEAH